MYIHWVRDIQFVLVMANSGVNPFVYAWRLQSFRKAFKSILAFPACFQRVKANADSLYQMATLSVNNPAPFDTVTGRVNPLEIKDKYCKTLVQEPGFPEEFNLSIVVNNR